MHKMKKNILITGTSSGIGKALTNHYLEKGERVLGISRRNVPELSARGDYKHLQLDLYDFNAIKEKFPEFIKGISEFHLVILNAGILPPIADMKDTSIETIKNVMDVNVWSNKLLLDKLINESNHVKQVVAISSGASVNGHRGWNVYSISKAALNMFTLLYARENPGTHFTALAPGIIDTNMQEYIAGLKQDERFPSIDRLQSARGTEKMPSPEHGAGILAKSFETIKSHESGSFVDIREL